MILFCSSLKRLSLCHHAVCRPIITAVLLLSKAQVTLRLERSVSMRQLNLPTLQILMTHLFSNTWQYCKPNDVDNHNLCKIVIFVVFPFSIVNEITANWNNLLFCFFQAKFSMAIACLEDLFGDFVACVSCWDLVYLASLLIQLDIWDGSSRRAQNAVTWFNLRSDQLQIIHFGSELASSWSNQWSFGHYFIQTRFS